MVEVCIMIPMHPKFVCFKIDAVCFDMSSPSIVESFVPQLFYKDLRIKGRVEVVPAVWKFLDAMDGSLAREKGIMWDVPAKPSATQLYPVTVVSFLSNHLEYPSLLEMNRPLSVVKWSDKWQRRLYDLEMKMLLATKRRVLSVTFKKSMIDDLQANPATLAARKFWKERCCWVLP